MDIVIQGVTFSHPVTSNQSLTIKYRNTALADIPANYVTVAENITVLADPTTPTTVGNINPDITISDLAAGTYAVYITNNCSGRTVYKLYTLVDDTPIVYVWMEDTYTCEQDAVFTQIGQVTNLSSPSTLFYDAPTGRVYGVDLDSGTNGTLTTNGSFFSYNPASFTSASQITAYQGVYKAGAEKFLYAQAIDAPSRRLFASGKDSDGIQVFDIATGNVQVVVWGLNHNVAPTGSGNGYPRASLQNVNGTIIGIDKYSQTIILLNPSTLAFSTVNIVDIPNYTECMIGAPVINEVNGEYWVLNNQGNNSEDPAHLPHVYRYNKTFTTLLGTIDLTNKSFTWSFGAYARSTYLDSENNRFYIYDCGANKMIVINTATLAIVHEKDFLVRQGKTGSSFGFVVDPITNDLFLSGNYADSSTDTLSVKTTYKVRRDTYALTNVYSNVNFGNLVRIGSTNELHGAGVGSPGWVTPSSWNADGTITKFTK
jgi:hypothetical protein